MPDNIVNNNSDLNRVSLISDYYNSFDLFNKLKGLKIIHFNAQSLVNKVNQFRLLCCVLKPDFLCISETWLTSDHSYSEFSIDNYYCYRCDRKNKRGGGVIIYALKNPNLQICKLDLESHNLLDYVIIKIKQKNTHPFYLSTVYCPPDQTSYLKNSFKDIFNNITNKDNIIVGDVNIDYHSNND